MKCAIIALVALASVASAQYISPYSFGYGYGYNTHPYTLNGLGLGYRSVPYAYTAPAHYAYAPPAIQTGYVAQTRGSLHTAPLPEGPLAFSHHINTAPAPGTF